MKHIKNLILLGALLLGILTTFNNQPVNAYHVNRHHKDEKRTAKGALIGGVTGTTIGGAVKGWKGAAIGGVVGFGLGSVIGASKRSRDPQDKLNKLYKKRDRLQSRMNKTKSEKRRARMQRSIDKVQDEIRKYEQPHNMKRVKKFHAS